MFSPEEVLPLVRAANAEQDAAIYVAAAFTGLRRSELLGLRWRDVDFAGSAIRLRASYAGSVVTTPKSGTVRSMRPLHFHDLRHTFGTRMIAKADICRLQEWMGHANIQTTMRYLHYAPREGDAALVAEAFAPVAERSM